MAKNLRHTFVEEKHHLFFLLTISNKHRIKLLDCEKRKNKRRQKQDQAQFEIKASLEFDDEDDDCKNKPFKKKVPEESLYPLKVGLI